MSVEQPKDHVTQIKELLFECKTWLTMPARLKESVNHVSRYYKLKVNQVRRDSQNDCLTEFPIAVSGCASIRLKPLPNSLSLTQAKSTDTLSKPKMLSRRIRTDKQTTPVLTNRNPEV